MKQGRSDKMQNVGALLGSQFDTIVSRLYSLENHSSIEVSDYLFNETGIRVTPRSIQRRIKALGLTRSRSDSYKLAIKKGRRKYDHLRKPVRSIEFRSGINLKKRYEVFKRDSYRCSVCGKSAKDGVVLVVDHIKPVVRGGSNSLDNLRILCRACNHGKMLAEERYV